MVEFETQRRGYDKEQVAAYFERVKTEFDNMYAVYQEILVYSKQLQADNQVLVAENELLKEENKKFVMSSEDKKEIYQTSMRAAMEVARRTAVTTIHTAPDPVAAPLHTIDNIAPRSPAIQPAPAQHPQPAFQPRPVVQPENTDWPPLCDFVNGER